MPLLFFYFFRPWQSCLSDPVDLFDRDAFLEFMSTYPGQDQTPNQQCQDILGLDSFYGWVGMANRITLAVFLWN